MKRKRFIIQFIAIISLIFGVVGCSDIKSTNKATKEDNKTKSEKIVRIGFQKGNTLNILKESGFLEKALEPKGYKVEFREFTQGNTLLEGIFTGHIDFGHASDGSGINAQSGNKPFVYVGADYPNPEGLGVLVHKDSGIKSVKDLKGKKVGTFKGGNMHYLAILAIKDAGLSIDDVEWVYLKDGAQMRTSFETKKIDALATYDPFFAAMELDLDTINLTEGKDYGYTNRTMYYANVEFNEAHPELVDIILDAIEKSDQWANKNKSDVVKLVATELKLDEKVIERAMDRRTFGVDRFNEEMVSIQQKQADLYFEIGIIPTKVDVSERIILK